MQNEGDLFFDFFRGWVVVDHWDVIDCKDRLKRFEQLFVEATSETCKVVRASLVQVAKFLKICFRKIAFPSISTRTRATKWRVHGLDIVTKKGRGSHMGGNHRELKEDGFVGGTHM